MKSDTPRKIFFIVLAASMLTPSEPNSIVRSIPAEAQNGSICIGSATVRSGNFRTRLHDMWNLRALTHSETEGTELEHGQPREQGHYGFMLTDLYLIPLLSGQNVDKTRGLLTLNPRFTAPYIIPVLIMNCEASLMVNDIDNKIKYTLQVAFGRVDMTTVVVDGCAHDGPVGLSAGEEVTWSC